jgi:hypothetical protein
MWWRADVASVLGYSCAGNAVANHVDDEYKLKFEELKGRMSTARPSNKQPHTIYINKSGLISLVLSSQPRVKSIQEVDHILKWCQRFLNTGEQNANTNMLGIQQTPTVNP